MTDLQRQRVVARAAGYQCLVDGRFEKAAAWFNEALRCFDAEGDAPSEDRSLSRAALVVAQTTAWFELERIDETGQPLLAALASLDGSAVAESPPGRVIVASLRIGLSRSLTVTRRLDDALLHLRAALELLQGSGADVVEAGVQSNLGAVLSVCGEPRSALPLVAAAAATLGLPQHARMGRERAAVVMNLACVHIELGRLDDACHHLEHAIALYDGLIAAGRSARRIDRARAQMNLGSTHVLAGRHAPALPCFQAALSDCEWELRHLRQRGAAARVRATLGSILMNLGHCQFMLHDFAAAQATLRRAIRGYAGLVDSHPYLRDDLARTWVNQGHLAARDGDLRRAARLYQHGLGVLASMLGDRPYLRPDHANAALGLARVRLLQGRADEAAALFETGMATLSALSKAGQLQQAWVWLEGWNAQLTALLQRQLAVRTGASARVRGAEPERYCEALLRVLAEPPRRALGDGSVPLQALRTALESIQRWTASAESVEPPISGLARLLGPYLAYVFECVADLLANGEPGWLAQHAPELMQTLARLRDIAAAQPEAAQLLAEWFLHTRGLRTQRSALAQGDSPELAELQDLLRALHRLEQEMLGEARVDPSETWTTSRATGLLSVSRNLPSPVQVQERAAVWEKLHARVEAMRLALVEAGHLPAAPRLTSAGITARMAPDTALVMLAQHDDQRVLAIVLRRSDTGHTIARHVVADQHPDLRHFSFATLNRLARQSLDQASRGHALRGAAAPSAGVNLENAPASVEDLDQFALELFGSVWQRTVLPLLQSLLDQGCIDVCLVASDELHLVPWTHFAETLSLPGSRVEVYPSCGAWWRRLQAGDEDAAPPRWAVAAWSALDSGRPLPWVEVERCLSEQLWRDLSGSVEVPPGERPKVDGVDALLGMGHGGAPDHNPAHAGLAMAGGCVLSAHDLPRIRTCRRVVLSACVLGRIDDAFGEPLGFLSSCFDYGTRFATGWLTEVPDAAACWASIAMQFALRQAFTSSTSRPVLWSQVFSEARIKIASGSWPDGFATWLARELPFANHELTRRGVLPSTIGLDRETLGVPPAELRRVMPWAVAFGR